MNKLKQARAAVGKEFKVLTESEIVDLVEFRDIIDRLMKSDNTLPDDLEKRDILGDPMDEYRRELRKLIQQEPALLDRARRLSGEVVLSVAQRHIAGYYILVENWNYKVPMIASQEAPITDWGTVLRAIKARQDEPVFAPTSVEEFLKSEVVRRAIDRLQDDFRTGSFALVRRTRLQIEIIRRLRQVADRLPVRRELKNKARRLAGLLSLGLKGFQERELRRTWREVKGERDEVVIEAIEATCDRLRISEAVIPSSELKLLAGEILRS